MLNFSVDLFRDVNPLRIRFDTILYGGPPEKGSSKFVLTVGPAKIASRIIYSPRVRSVVIFSLDSRSHIEYLLFIALHEIFGRDTRIIRIKGSCLYQHEFISPRKSSSLRLFIERVLDFRAKAMNPLETSSVCHPGKFNRDELCIQLAEGIQQSRIRTRALNVDAVKCS